VFGLSISVTLALVLGLVSACGGSEEEAVEAPQEVPSPTPSTDVVLGSAAVQVPAKSMVSSASLVSFDSSGRLRVHTTKGTTYLLSSKAPASLEWTLTAEESATLGLSGASGDGLFRASADTAWRFSATKVTTYYLQPASAGTAARWRVFESPVTSVWRPLAVEDKGIIAHTVDGVVRTASLKDGKLVTQELKWPKGVEAPSAAGFLRGSSVIWIYGGGHFYLTNVDTGVWRSAAFDSVDKAWGTIKSMAFRANAKDDLGLSRPQSFAVLGGKGLFALPFKDAPR